MKITKKSMFSGMEHTMDLPVTMEQLARFQNGVSVQIAFPDLDAAQREFILTGVTAEEWDAEMGEEPDDSNWFNCGKCGQLMFIEENGVSHHAGDTSDGIDHDADAHHVAIKEEPST